MGDFYADSLTCVHKIGDILSQPQFNFDEAEIPINRPHVFHFFTKLNANKRIIKRIKYFFFCWLLLKFYAMLETMPD